MRYFKKNLAALLCVCLCLCPLAVCADASPGNAYTQIGEVRFYGGRRLEEIDLSTMVRDEDTLANGTLYLCRIYDEPQTAIETWNYDRIANFEFSEEKSGLAVLADYPGAEAPVDPGDYVLFSPKGDLFDDVPFYAFSAKEYYRNTPPAAYGLRPNTVGLPAFEDFAVVRAEGETVSTMRMTLDPALASFYDAVNPDGEIAIDCKYGYGADDVFFTISARPAAYDAESGVLTIELLDADGSVGTNLHNFRMNDEDYGYIFRFTFFAGLFTCGSAKSAHSFVQISGRAVDGMPERIFTHDTSAGRTLERLHGMLYSEKPAKLRFAKTALQLLNVHFCLRLTNAGLASVRAFSGNTDDDRALHWQKARDFVRAYSSA
ncbi:MAG: hypothetical protein IJT44_08045 [Clostridia bacterium]|nr:hypothetical protein [Clostridia bacterium]